MYLPMPEPVPVRVGAAGVDQHAINQVSGGPVTPATGDGARQVKAGDLVEAANFQHCFG